MTEKIKAGSANEENSAAYSPGPVWWEVGDVVSDAPVGIDHLITPEALEDYVRALSSLPPAQQVEQWVAMEAAMAKARANK